MNSRNQALGAATVAALHFALVGPAHAQDKNALEPKTTAATAKTDAAKTQPEKTAAPVPAAAPATATLKLNYLPSGKGVPIRREGGATRGAGGGDPRELALSVVTPEHVGWSSHQQPELYWFVSRPVSSSVVLTIAQVDGSAIDPLYEGNLPPPREAGLQRVSLRELKLSLDAGAEYEWSISLVSDPQARLRDILASGRIRWVPLPDGLRTTLGSATEEQRTERLASAGYWYDVVDLLRRRPASVATEISLYESAGLSRIARFLRDGS